MSTRKAELQIAVSGEKEYKQAINELNQGNKVLTSEMKLLQEQYKGNEDSMEALNAKSDLLQRQLSQQKDKVETLRAALENSAKQYGESDKRTQSWQIQLNNAEREELALQRQLQETNEALNDQGEAAENDGKKMATLGDQVSGIAEKFGVHLPKSVKDALNHVDGFSTGTVVAMGAAVAAVGAVKLAIDGITAGIEVANKLHQMTLEQAAKADELLTRSSQTGLSVETLQELDYAELMLDFEGLDKSLAKLTDSMGKAVTGAEKQQAAFAKLGVAVTDENGQLRDNWDVMLEVIDALGQVENATERDLWANELFGKSYAELKPLIDAGSESLLDLMQAAEESGYVLSEDQVKTLGEVDDAYNEMQAQIEATKNKLAVEFAPISERVMTSFGQFVMTAGQKIVDSGILEKLEGFLEPLDKMLGAFLDLIDWILPALTPLVDGLATAFGWLADHVASFVQWFTSVDWEQTVSTTMAEVGDMGYYGGYNPAFAAAGDADWKGGLTWVGEAGPELVSLPAGTKIYSNQESTAIAAAGGTDTRRMEELLARSVALQERIAGEVAGLRVKARMA